MGVKTGNSAVRDLRAFEIRQPSADFDPTFYDSRRPLAVAPSYSFSRRRRKPRRPWGMKITMAVKMMPTGIR
jgi:hypothetical protein